MTSGPHIRDNVLTLRGRGEPLGSLLEVTAVQLATQMLAAVRPASPQQGAAWPGSHLSRLGAKQNRAQSNSKETTAR